MHLTTSSTSSVFYLKANAQILFGRPTDFLTLNASFFLSSMTLQKLAFNKGVQGVVMRNTIAYPTQESSSPSRGIPCSHKRGNDDRVTAV